MSVSSQPKKKSTGIAENTAFSSNWGAGGRIQERNIAPALRNSRTRLRIRMKKVLAIRQQLAEGRYDLDKRLDAVLCHILCRV